jgi:hypothetical protein
MHQIIDFAQTSGILALRERDRFNPGHPVILSSNTQTITFSSQKDQNPIKTHLKRPLPCSRGALQPPANRAFFRNSKFTLISFSRRRLAQLRFVTKGPKRSGFSPCSYFVQDRCPFFPLPIHLPSASICVHRRFHRTTSLVPSPAPKQRFTGGKRELSLGHFKGRHPASWRSSRAGASFASGCLPWPLGATPPRIAPGPRSSLQALRAATGRRGASCRQTTKARRHEDGQSPNSGSGSPLLLK